MIIYDTHDLSLAAVIWAQYRMPLTLQSPAAAGGLTAALVSAFLKASSDPVAVPLPSAVCQELATPSGLELHWPSILVGIILGIFLGQVFEAVVLARHFLSLHLRQRAAGFCNALSIRSRGG